MSKTVLFIEVLFLKCYNCMQWHKNNYAQAVIGRR